MDTYYTIEEKYLQAVDELSWGEMPRALNLLNELIANDPLYGRAHFQLGKIYYYEIKDYQTAGYHFKTCMEIEPLFPDNYFHYLSLVVFLKMEKQVNVIASAALKTSGVNAAAIYELFGLFAEKNKEWNKALKAYRKAYLEATDKDEMESTGAGINRVKLKIQQAAVYQYTLAE
jgi:tetratricopeptide (TPR) repeat protein